MKKILSAILAVMIACPLLASCAEPNLSRTETKNLLSGVFSDNKPTPSSQTASTEPPPETTEEITVDPVTGWALNNCEFEKDECWPEPLRSTDDLLKIVSQDEIDAAEERVQKEIKKTYDWWYRKKLPPIWWIIRELDISKEDFLNATDRDKYPLRTVELLFEEKDPEVIRSELKFDNVFLYDGKLYTIEDIRRLGIWKTKEMAKEGSVLEFLSNCKSFCENFYPYSHKIEYIGDLISRIENVGGKWDWDVAADRYWSDELYNVAELVSIMKERSSNGEKEVVDASYKLSATDKYYIRSLPTLYLLIRELNISKEDFRRVADRDWYPDWVVDLLFGDEGPEYFRAAMKSDCAFLYEDYLYTIYDLNALKPSKLKEMAEKGDLLSFLEDYKTLGPSYLSSSVDEVLEKLG